MICNISCVDVYVWVSEYVPVSICNFCPQGIVITLFISPNPSGKGFSFMFNKLKDAINWAVITSFLTKEWVLYTTVDKIVFVTSEDNVYEGRRVFSKVGGFCDSLIKRNLFTNVSYFFGGLIAEHIKVKVSCDNYIADLCI